MKFRKIGASLLAAAMLVGSCLTASAAEIPPETCTVDYKPMSSSVNVSMEKDGDTGILNLEITGEAEGDQVIVLSDIFELFASDYYMPGDTQNMKVNIVNHSGHSYQYKDSSFVLVPPDADKTFGSLEDGALLPILGFDGQYLPLRSVGAMLPKYFYEILGASKETRGYFRADVWRAGCTEGKWI